MISRRTGSNISEVEHIYQSINMILTTPIGSRVMRRDFGSNIYKLVDRGISPSVITAIYAEIHQSLSTWEPRIRVISTTITNDTDDTKQGILNISVEFEFQNQAYTAEVLLSPVREEPTVIQTGVLTILGDKLVLTGNKALLMR